MPTNLQQYKDEYQRLFDTCVIKESKYPEIDSYISKMTANKSSYDAVSKITKIPWNFIAITHCMEGSLNFKTHLHNGDPLSARTVQVPKGRPANGNPPFSWEESAVDALTFEGFTALTDWSVPGMLYCFERYNGFGNRRYGINSPYLWSYSNHYSKGKFSSDGHFDPDAISKQCGAAVILRRMSEKQIAVVGQIDRITMIKQLGEQVSYAPNTYNEKAEQLQAMLNSVGVHLKADGKAGRMTSDAYFSIAGKYLKGDKGK